jgi:hypothetical protein
MAYVVAIVASLAVGMGLGFTAFRRSLQWCWACGERLTCARCLPPAPAHQFPPTNCPHRSEVAAS